MRCSRWSVTGFKAFLKIVALRKKKCYMKHIYKVLILDIP